MADSIPYDLEGLLALLERLDGAEEAAVVRSAHAAGYPRDRVMEELLGLGARERELPALGTIDDEGGH